MQANSNTLQIQLCLQHWVLVEDHIQCAQFVRDTLSVLIVYATQHDNSHNDHTAQDSLNQVVFSFSFGKVCTLIDHALMCIKIDISFWKESSKQCHL